MDKYSNPKGKVNRAQTFRPEGPSYANIMKPAKVLTEDEVTFQHLQQIVAGRDIA